MWFGMFGLPGIPSMPDEPAKNVHWTVELPDAVYEVLLRWMRTTGRSYSSVSAEALEQFERAVQCPGPVPPVVDWSALEARQAEGYAVADQIFDNLPPKKAKP